MSTFARQVFFLPTLIPAQGSLAGTAWQAIQIDRFDRWRSQLRMTSQSLQFVDTTPALQRP
ncbi:hypothetical protein [Synechococcus elongatus]|uniref:hypothetical protein n=1 Tax=Synechococcus elongatus TaxID=32046 RepID=UPI0030D1C399